MSILRTANLRKSLGRDFLMRKWSSVAVLCLMLMIASGVAHAGPAVLNPPTYPVCTSDYPILLNTGSYILGSNFTVTCSKDVFEIIGNNVTLDLGGYTITGKGGVGSGNGVSGGEHYNVTVKNGTILNVPGKGIAIGENATVTDVAVFGAGGVGISVESGTIRHVQSDGNGSDGVDSLDTQSPAAVEDSQVSGNNGNGIAASNALISNNTLIGNFEFGLECAGCTITRNTVEENGAGILSFFSQITDNTVLFNFGDGIITPEPSS